MWQAAARCPKFGQGLGYTLAWAKAPAPCSSVDLLSHCLLSRYSQDLSREQEQLFKYIEDAELWRWRLPNSKAFHSGLGSLHLEYDTSKNPAIFDQLLGQTPEGLIARCWTAQLFLCWSYVALHPPGCCRQGICSCQEWGS